MRGQGFPQLAYLAVTCALCLPVLGGDPAGPSTKPTTQPLLHVPDDPSQAKAEKMVREVFGREYATQVAAQRVGLAQRMIQQACDTADDSAARFVLLREARDMAASAGEAATAQRAIRLMAQWYAIDPLKMLVAAMSTAQAAAISADSQVAIAQVCLAAVDRAVIVDDYATATRLISLAESAATAAKNVPLVTHAKERSKALQAIFLEYQLVEKSRQVLKESRDDQEACARVGRFLCLYKAEWNTGLPLVVRGSESVLRTMARDDLGASENPQKRLGVADGWWELSQSQSPLVRKNLQRRAAWWYRQVLPQLNGFHRAIAQERIEAAELEVLRDQNLLPGLMVELFKGIEFKQAVKVRVDDQINFDWGNESPDPAVPKDNFALRWSGMIRPPAAGKYELVVMANTGVRLWLDEKLILDRASVARNRNGVRAAVEFDEQLKAIRLEYWDTTGTARMKVWWRVPGATKDEVIPASAFFHDASMVPVGVGR